MIAWLRRLFLGEIASELPKHPVLRCVSDIDADGAIWWHEVHGDSIPWAAKTHEVGDGPRAGEITRTQLAPGMTAPIDHAVVIAHSARRALEEWRFWTRCSARDLEPRLIYIDRYLCWMALPPT